MTSQVLKYVTVAVPADDADVPNVPYYDHSAIVLAEHDDVSIVKSLDRHGYSHHTCGDQKFKITAFPDMNLVQLDDQTFTLLGDDAIVFNMAGGIIRHTSPPKELSLREWREQYTSERPTGNLEDDFEFIPYKYFCIYGDRKIWVSSLRNGETCYMASEDTDSGSIDDVSINGVEMFPDMVEYRNELLGPFLPWNGHSVLCQGSMAYALRDEKTHAIVESLYVSDYSLQFGDGYSMFIPISDDVAIVWNEGDVSSVVMFRKV